MPQGVRLIPRSIVPFVSNSSFYTLPIQTSFLYTLAVSSAYSYMPWKGSDPDALR